MKSIWEAKRPEFNSLEEDIKTDVLIIGGGITGILCAYMLKEAGVECVLVEADKICSGITKNTTAKVTSQHGLIYNKLIKSFGTDTARFYFEANEKALEKYKILSKTYYCDFEECNSYVYSRENRKKIEDEAEALCKIGYEPIYTEKTPLPFYDIWAVGVKDQAQFNPLKFLYAMAENLPIYENTKALEFESDGVSFENGKIKADKIIVATHFPILNKHGSYFMKLYQHRSYVIAYENVPEIDGMYVDEDKKGMSVRHYNGALLLGGGGHRTGKQGGNWNEIGQFAKKFYSNAKEICRWATQDCMTLDDVPYIGQYSKNTPNLYVATGYNKWGMTSSMVAASVLTDLIQGKENIFSEIFLPSRSILKPQLAINAAESIAGLLNLRTPRCPHLGCGLKYNPQEHSWDCSCHGSRFTKEGKLIDNPATDNLDI